MVSKEISKWLSDYAWRSGCHGFIIGASGGIDSSVTSALCAETNMPVLAVTMPIHQNEELHSLSLQHLAWLRDNYPNADSWVADLSGLFDAFALTVPSSDLGYANTKARLRMCTLYALGAPRNFLVVGTGNRVEDFGVGFFTKYGDGGVDISPIGNLMKSEVYELAKELNILQSIIDSPPTDGLWDDGRDDESQLMASYDEIEWAMRYDSSLQKNITSRQKEVLAIFAHHKRKNGHKMKSIPVWGQTS
jgi:NAD+ synthase